MGETTLISCHARLVTRSKDVSSWLDVAWDTCADSGMKTEMLATRGVLRHVLLSYAMCCKYVEESQILHHCLYSHDESKVSGPTRRMISSTAAISFGESESKTGSNGSFCIARNVLTWSGWCAECNSGLSS